MRTRIYIDGVPSWSENQPSHARLHGVRGSLVTGASGPNDRGREYREYHAQKQKEHLARKKAQKT